MSDMEPLSFSIVGVGASAGGLEAFSDFLQALPADSGMAFVFIQHLDPKHASLLPSLLARHSPIPVYEVHNGQLVKPDHLYVLPPRHFVTLSNGSLQLHPRQEASEVFHPVDVFFRSLVSELGPKAIGIILSGTGNDGQEGIAAIEKAGGRTYAQLPVSARYAGMPQTAILGHAQTVLEPNAIAERLIGGNSADSSGRSAEHHSEQSMLSDAHFLDLVLELLHKFSGVRFAGYKRPSLKRRLLRRMEKQGSKSNQEYWGYLVANAAEQRALCEDFL